ncbi:aminomethyl-transferring glycine dehydrogenase subunit GcvPB [Spirochaeta lutea]|uniref:aminomethyl-transferring glycine dehydrogenase subunit GcvPB n=1 Tax=Spirochaeta lutea TaxID=1480694 RepID=UPI00068AEB63|nr:aminomethyl-transferring glycine dehydrogenase subunit GcvPB [Spirochaeta lutea]
MDSYSRVVRSPALLWETPESGGVLSNLPELDVPRDEYTQGKGVPKKRRHLTIPDHSELEVVRHFKGLGRANFSIDDTMYPLGSCTMKYNPKISEEVAGNSVFKNTHPYSEAGEELHARIVHGLQDFLVSLTGLPGVSLTPAAGAQGELSGVLIIREYQRQRGSSRQVMLIPDSAHGTNPASVAMAGLVPKTIKTGPEGRLRLADVLEVLDESVAGIMVTNPNTLGIFEHELPAIAEAVHEIGGLVYGDGANFNAIAGIIRPGDLGVDIMHINLHKTFGTPHGGGGPGAGPLCVTRELAPFLPGPVAVSQTVSHKSTVTELGNDSNDGREGSRQSFRFVMPERSVGRVRTFYGNFGITLRAYVYILVHGLNGIRRNSIQAVLNANYLRKRLQPTLSPAFGDECMHEFVCPNPLVTQGVHTIDIAKRMLDYGIHAPTVYFPLIVKEALMIEPTESESLAQLDALGEVLEKIVKEGLENAETLKRAPHNLPLGRLDELLANKKPVYRHRLGG